MKKIKSVILASIGCAIILAIVDLWVSHFDWAFLPYVILAGCFIVWIQKEEVSYKFLDKLLAGSLLFAFLMMFLVFLKMYLFSGFIYDSPLPFKELWDKDTIILALVYSFLSFLGGLVGIVLKGFYSLYKEKLNWVIVFVGPFFTTIASLAVFKVKIGGTIMSGYYGLPYHYFVYQFKDVVDGFFINKLIFSPGSFYHYIIFDYLAYLMIFVLFFYALKLINKRLKEKINITFVLFGLLILIIMIFISFLPIKKTYIEYQINEAGYCNRSSDCILAEAKCPFGCGVAINRIETNYITNLIYSFPSTCEYKCGQILKAFCLKNRCQVSIDNTPENIN